MNKTLLQIIIFTIVLMIGVAAADADIVFIGWGAPQELRLQVGAASGITTVVHNVPSNHIGDATPVQGAPNSILIDAYARRANFFSALFSQFIISVDSSAPLSNGSHTIPFSDISWTAQDGDIPSGNFNGTPGQVIAGPVSAFQRISDRLTFYYNNSQVVPSGVYFGQVTYTIAIP